MSVLNHLGQAAALLLLIELLVVVLIIFAVAGGLVFGLHWSRGKTGWAFDKTNAQLPKVRHYADLANHYLALPVIKGTAFAHTARITIDTIERQIRDARAGQVPPTTPPPVAPPAAAVSVAGAEATEPIPAP